MATAQSMTSQVRSTTSLFEKEDEKSWVLPVWRSSIVLGDEADLTDVSFYPYANKGEDPVFAVVGIGMIAIYKYEGDKNSENGTIKALHIFRDKDDFKYIHDDDPEKAEKTADNLGDKDTHHRSRAIAWARREDNLPLLCVTGAGDIQPSKKIDPVGDEPAFFPPIAVNTLIKVINPYTGERIQTLIGHGKTINALETSPTVPHILASAADDKNIYLWSLARAHTKAPCIAVIGGWGHIDRVLSLAWHSTGNWLLSGGFDNRACLWHVPQESGLFPGWNKPCGEWTAQQILMPHFVSSEVHRHPVERVEWMDDTIISHGMAEPHATQWRIQGFSSATPAEMLPTNPSFHDEEARTRSAWDFADRDKVQHPLYRRLLRFAVPEKLDEMLDDLWCERRRFVDFDVYVPAKRRESKPGASQDHTHATMAVCKGDLVRFWDFKRLLRWHKESKKPSMGHKLELPWEETVCPALVNEEKKVEVEKEIIQFGREITPPAQLAGIDPDDPDAEVMRDIMAHVSAQTLRSAEKARREAERASANSTPTKSRPERTKKQAARKTAPSTGGAPSESADSPEKSVSVGSTIFQRKTIAEQRADKELAERKRLDSIKAKSDVSDVSHISGQKDVTAEEDAIASFRFTQQTQPRKAKPSLKSRIESRLEKENKRGDNRDKDQDGDYTMGFDGARSPRPAKVASRKTAPSTGGVRLEYGFGMDGAGDERLRPRSDGSMSLESVHASRVARGYEPADQDVEIRRNSAIDVRPRGGTATNTAHSIYARAHIGMSLDGASDEPPRRHGAMSLASIQASRAARRYSIVVPNGAAVAPSRGVPARKTAPSTGGVGPWVDLPIDGVGPDAIDIPGDEEDEDTIEDSVALREAETALLAQPPVNKRKLKAEIEKAESAAYRLEYDQKEKEIKIGLRERPYHMRHDENHVELEHMKQSVIAAQHREEIEQILAERRLLQERADHAALVAANAKAVRKNRARPRTEQGLRAITGKPIDTDVEVVSSDEEDVKHIPGFQKYRYISWIPRDGFERMGKRWGYISGRKYDDNSPILIVRTDEKGIVQNDGQYFAHPYDIGKRLYTWNINGLIEDKLPRKRYKLLPIGDLPKWERLSFSPTFGCWLAPPRPEYNVLETQVRQRVDELGHMDSEGAYFIKTRHRQKDYKVAHELKRGGEFMESDSDPELPPPKPIFNTNYGSDNGLLDYITERQRRDDGTTERSVVAQPIAPDAPDLRTRQLQPAAVSSNDQYDSDGDSTTLQPSRGQRGRKRPLDDDPLKIHACPLCERRFGGSEHFKRHYITVHKQLKDFECQKCGKKFNRKDNRDQHGRTCNGGWVVEGFGFLARQSDNEEEIEPVMRPAARRRPMAFGLDGAGSDDGRGRPSLRGGALSDSGSASMQESSSPEKKSLQTREEAATSSHNNAAEAMDVDNADVDSTTGTKKPASGYQAALARKARSNSATSTASALKRTDSVLSGNSSKTGKEVRASALSTREPSTDSSRRSSRGEHIGSYQAALARMAEAESSTSNSVRSAPKRAHSAMSENSNGTAKDARVSGLSTRDASADSSGRPSKLKRMPSRRSELDIDMLDTNAVKAGKKTKCDSCGVVLKGKGRRAYSYQVPGEGEDDPPREFCASCYERGSGDGKGKDTEQEKTKDRRTSVTNGGRVNHVCCLCGSTTASKWHYSLHKEEKFDDGKVCCRPCHARDYRERMRPGSTTKPQDRGRKRAREPSPEMYSPEEIPEEATNAVDKALGQINLDSPNIDTSSPVKSSSPSKDKNQPKEEPRKEKPKIEGWEKYHMGDAWRPLDAHGVVKGDVTDKVLRCCKWSPDGRLLVVVGDKGVVSCFVRP